MHQSWDFKSRKLNFLQNTHTTPTQLNCSITCGICHHVRLQDVTQNAYQMNVLMDFFYYSNFIRWHFGFHLILRIRHAWCRMKCDRIGIFNVSIRIHVFSLEAYNCDELIIDCGYKLNASRASSAANILIHFIQKWRCNCK